MKLEFTKLSKKGSRYRVYGVVRSTRFQGTETTEIGIVDRVEVHKNPWSDRQPVMKWAAYSVDGEQVAVCSTRQDAAERLVPR